MINQQIVFSEKNIPVTLKLVESMHYSPFSLLQNVYSVFLRAALCLFSHCLYKNMRGVDPSRPQAH